MIHNNQLIINNNNISRPPHKKDLMQIEVVPISWTLVLVKNVMYSSSSSSAGLKPLMDHKAVGNPASHPPTSEASTVTTPAEVGTAHLITHLHDSMCLKWGLTTSLQMQKHVLSCVVFPLNVESSRPQTSF